VLQLEIDTIRADEAEVPAVGLPIVVVLGMHRSGTSLCANILQAMGVNMAEMPGIGPSNVRGHWERTRINDLNDRVFAMFGRSWITSAHVLALPEHWLEDPRVAAVGRELVAWLWPQWATFRFGFKDPRTARLLPLWRQVFATLGATPHWIFCVRDPAQVARSVSKRDQMPQQQGAYRWQVYNADAVRGVGTDPVCIVPYEHWFTRPEETGARLAAFLDAAPPPAALLHHLIDPALRHDADSATPACTLGQRLHGHILASVPGGRFSAALRDYCDVLGDFERAVQPLLTDMEVLRVSVLEQNRVIADLDGALRAARSGKH
jgi:hypothetical protein